MAGMIELSANWEITAAIKAVGRIAYGWADDEPNLATGYELVSEATEIVKAVVSAFAEDNRGRRLEWCETHNVPQKTRYVPGFSGERECQSAPYSTEQCQLVDALLVVA